VIVALAGVAVYSLVVVAIAVSQGEGHGSVFWTAIGIFVLIAAAAGWFALRIYRTRFSRTS
jgi:hypothetical protein